MEKTMSNFNFSESHYFALAVVAVVIISWLGLLDIASAEYIDGAIVQATLAFGVARLLNAAVSVAQSIEGSVVVVTVGFGEILDPLNDLVEQYSTLMKYAIASLLVQKLLLTITSNVVFKVLLTLVGAVAVGASFLGNKKYFLFGVKMFVFIGFLRFALVLVVILNGLVNQFFLNEQIEEEVAEVGATAEQVQEVSEEQAIDPDLKAELEARLQVLENKQEVMLAEQNRINDQLVVKNKELEQAQAVLSSLEGKLGLTERINIFDRNEDHAKAIEKRNLIKDEVNALEDQADEIDELLIENDKAQVAARNTLEGKANSWMEAVGDATSNIAGDVKEKFTGQINALVESLNDLVPNVLNLMAAFILKTLILPLLFLYAVVLLTKAIWNINLREFDLPKQKKEQDQLTSV